MLRRQRAAGAEKAPAARSGEPQRGTLRCAIAVRSRRAHARAERPTSARAVEGAVRSTPAAADAIRPKACAIRVDRGARWLNTCRRVATTPQTRSATPQSSFEDLVSPSRRKRRPYRTVFMGGRSEDAGLPVGGRAGQGGSHGAAWVRVRVKPRAWQRLPRRLQSALAGPPRLNVRVQVCLLRGMFAPLYLGIKKEHRNVSPGVDFEKNYWGQTDG